MRAYIRVLLLAFFCALCAWAKPPQTGIQVTTKSSQARAYFDQALARQQTLHLDEALDGFRKAVQADPQFALGHMLLSYFSQDPAEQVSERDKALASKELVSREEQLLIAWLSDSSKGQWIPAIQAMNDLQSQYKNHREIAWLSGMWLTNQQQWGRAIEMYRRAIEIDRNFADAWNSVAYCYARTRDFEKAFAAMKRYTALLPKEPNPQDSFAEISRMGGRYDDALVHYRAALKLDPKFISSQVGIADTYALMGDEKRARAEYAVALKQTTDKVQSILWALQAATTYVRENNDSAADTAFQAVVRQAHENDLGNLEAEAYRAMSLYQKKGATALELLAKAEAVLHEDHKVSQALLDQETAAILRARVDRAAQEGNFDLASATLKKLETLTNSSSDAAVALAYDGASGTLLLAQGNYAEAIPHLEEDDRDPFSMRRLVQAYEKNGAKDGARHIAENLAGFDEPSIEQAIVVPAFRTKFSKAASH
jgi:tetratricopeptide (TPR) repeat protein